MQVRATVMHAACAVFVASPAERAQHRLHRQAGDTNNHPGRPDPGVQQWDAGSCVCGAVVGVAAGASEGQELRVQLGRAIRQLKANWKLGVVLVPLLQLPAATPLGIEPGSADAAADSPAAAEGSPQGGAADTAGPGSQDSQVQQQQAAVQLLLSAAQGFGLEDCWQWKPLLDGKQVGFIHSVLHL